MTSFLQQLTTRTVLKGQNFYSISYGRLDTKYPGRRLKSSRTKLNTWHSTSPKASLSAEQKQTVCLIPTPTTKRQVCEFLGATEFCWIWIPHFSLLAKPLYEATKGGKRDPLTWESTTKGFLCLQEGIISGPVPVLPDVKKTSFLYVHQRNSMAIGVLTQYLGAWHRPAAYLSKQLNSVAKGRFPCLRALTVTALLISEAENLTLSGSHILL
jgi:hypothetical protein